MKAILQYCNKAYALSASGIQRIPTMHCFSIFNNVKLQYRPNITMYNKEKNAHLCCIRSIITFEEIEQEGPRQSGYEANLNCFET